MKYRVKEGQQVSWPNGRPRARAGEVFEGHDTGGVPARNVLARRWMQGQWTRCVPVIDEDEQITACGNEMPDVFFNQMKDAGGVDAATYKTRVVEPGLRGSFESEVGVEHVGVDIVEMEADEDEQKDG